MFQRKTPFEWEWEKLNKKEQKFLLAREQKKDSVLNQKLSEKVPAKLQGTLDKAFAKAFGMIFEKGTGLIEKTHKKEELEKTFKINEYTDDVRQSKKSLKAFGKKAETPEDYDEKLQIEKTAAGLSKELLYMKFLQGIPIIGAVGGIYDAVYMKRITQYANLKYKKRFLVKKKQR